MQQRLPQAGKHNKNTIVLDYPYGHGSRPVFLTLLKCQGAVELGKEQLQLRNTLLTRARLRVGQHLRK